MHYKEPSVYTVNISKSYIFYSVHVYFAYLSIDLNKEHVSVECTLVVGRERHRKLSRFA